MARMTRQQAFELQAAETRRRWERTRKQASDARGYYNRSQADMANTLGPQEDVVESRRMTRNRVVMSAPRAATTKSILMENLLLLILLVASIYGLYCLSIHLLNQSSY